MTLIFRSSSRFIRSGSRPASASASFTAAIASGVTRETCWRSLALTYCDSSKPEISPATRTTKADASKCEIVFTPLIPALVASQKASRPIPFGLTAPMPVTTTRRSEPDILYLFLQVESKLFSHAPLQVANHRSQLARRAATGVENQVGMIVGHLDAAGLHALSPHLFQEPGGGNFALADYF